jgi:glutamate synthase (NADPH/NADH) small chain
MANPYCSPLDITQIEQNFADINPALTPAEAMHEANRCLYCFDAPCMHACPTHIDVPGFIRKIASGNLVGSARVIFDANPIGATCARVCPVEALCEGACVEKTLLQKPIEIGRLQRYATDYALTNGNQIFEKGESNGNSIGIIGSGPAGISCAAYLSRLGYDVTVYDRKPLAGGLDTYGMAEYKMPQSVSLSETERLAAMGVKFMLNTEITGGNDETEVLGEVNRVSFAMLKEWHHVVFIGAGLGATNTLGVPGEELEGVYDALHFIEKVKTRDWRSVPLGKTVAVIGAGNTAVDAVTQAKRLGAERVIMVYRRTEKDAPAYDYEMELAKKDGIEFLWNTIPTAIGGHAHVSSIRVRTGEYNEYKIDCDMVIKAIGQTKMASFFDRVCGVQTDEKGRVVVNDQMQTSDPKVFAGGDCVNGGGEAVEAAQMGKLAAQGIHSTLSGESVQFAGAAIKAVDDGRVHAH